MKETVEIMRNKIRVAVERAGRNRSELNRAMDRLETDIKRQTGGKKVDWTDEYYVHLLESYSEAASQVLSTAIEREEYEWADAIKRSMDRVQSTMDLLTEKMEK